MLLLEEVDSETTKTDAHLLMQCVFLKNVQDGQKCDFKEGKIGKVSSLIINDYQWGRGGHSLQETLSMELPRAHLHNFYKVTFHALGNELKQ